MIRRLLPQPPHNDLHALDAALLRGDLCLAQDELARIVKALPEDRQTQLHLALRAGVFAYLANRMDEAREMIAPLLQPPHEGSSSNRTAATYLLLALTYIDQKKERDAQEALLVAQDLVKNRILPAAYCRLASCTLDLYFNRYEAAASGLSGLGLLFEQQGEQWGKWQAVRLEGLVAHQRTRYADALHLLSAARQGYAQLGDLYEVARCDKALANTFRRLSQPSEAQQHAEKALAYFAEQALVIPAARCRNTLGSIQLEFDQEADAMISFQAAAEGFQTAGLDLELASVLHNIGLLYRFQGQFRPALTALARARAIAADLNVRDVEAAIAEQQAPIFRHIGQTDKALEHLKAAVDIYIELGASGRAAICRLDTATLLLEEGRHAEAMLLFETCRDTFSESADAVSIALADIGVARLHLANRRPEAAIPRLIAASRQLRERRHIRQAGVADIWLGSAALEVGQTEAAEAAFRRAREGAAIGSFDIAWRAAAGLATLARQDKNWDQAQTYLDEAIALLNRLRTVALSPQAASRLSQESLPIYQHAVDLALERGNPERGLAILENQKALHFAQQYAEIQARSAEDAPIDWRLPPSPRHDLDPVRHIVAQIDALRQALIAPAEDSDPRRLERLEAEFQHLTDTLAAHNAPYAALFQPPQLDIDRVRALLDARHGAGQWGCLSFGWLDEAPNQLHRFWLDSERLLASPKPMTRLHQRLVSLACRPEPSYRRHLLGWRSLAAAPAEWQQLQELLIPADFASYLATTPTLYLSPSGPLAAFPFAALVMDRQPLGLQFAMSQTPSLPLLEALLLRSTGLPVPLTLADTRALVCVLSSFPDRPGAQAIPAADREIGSLVGAIAPGSLVLLNEHATVGRLRQLQTDAELADYTLLHFATHAYLNPYHPHLARLIMWEDDLFVADIMAWRLQARLVVLAACDTAVGHHFNGDEQMGLPHAFILAGADTLLASLQPIPDETAADFIAGFYDALTPGNLSIAQALLAARRRYAAQGNTPLDWCALTLVGLA